MLEAALFRLNGIPRNVLHLTHDRLAVEVGKLHASRGNDSHIAVGEKKNIAGVMEDGRDIGGDEIFVIAQADNGRRAIAGSYDLVGLVSRDHGESKHS